MDSEIRKTPAFSYFGSKNKVAHLYPQPKYDTIIEPYAGAANYSLRYPDRDVILIERNQDVIDTWKYLINAQPEDIIGLPSFKDGDNLDDFRLTHGEKLFCGFWASRGSDIPKKTFHFHGNNPDYWERVKDSVSHIVPKIKHWTITHVDDFDFRFLPLQVTYFIDPPYQTSPRERRYYKYHDVAYDALADWIKWNGSFGDTQIIVCEREGADWLPFKPLTEQNGMIKKTKEVYWTNE